MGKLDFSGCLLALLRTSNCCQERNVMEYYKPGGGKEVVQKSSNFKFKKKF